MRVSTSQQVEGHSLAAQRAKIEAWAAYQGLPAPTIYEDAGISGAKKDRPGLTALLLDLQPSDIVVTYSITRLSRSGAVQLLEIVQRIRDSGARLVSLVESIDTGNHSGRMMLTMLAGMAEMELEQTRERSEMGKTQAAKMGIYPQNPKGLPTGYTTNAEGRIVADEHAETVRRIFARGKASYRSTAALLNAEGIPTRDGKQGGWEVFQVQRIITCDAYWRGEWIYRAKSKAGEKVSIPAPALITREEWEGAQRERTYNARNRQPDIFPLTGHVRCSCGARLTGSTIKYPTQAGTKSYSIYQCHIRSRKTPVCPAFGLASPRFTYDALHAEARRLLVDLFLNPDDPAHLAAAWLPPAPTLPNAANRERADLERKLEALVDLYLESLIEKPAYEQRRATLMRRIAQLTPEAPVPTAAMPSRPELAGAVEAATLEELGEFLNLLEVEFEATGQETLRLTRFKPLA